ncbi:hypothetical protein V6N11_000086 [Hibiscus sabdariffa]|uniref:Uncharacterized protein n=1 Tax=Hibiscus sabdariffa TaxID=183260 RepID=A0ABR2NNM1_9ROSI
MEGVSGNPSEGNPSAPNRNSVPFGLHGGQPSGSGADLGSVKILERLASPIELEAVRAPKKGRSDTGLATSMEDEESVVDGLGSGAAKLPPLTGEGPDGKTATYAAMLAKSGAEGGGAKQTLNFTEDEVVVLDEDYLVDESGAFSTIKFSDHVHDQIDKSRGDPSEEREILRDVGPRLEADGSLSERFGPWTVAASWRRRYTVPNIVDMDSWTEKGHKSGSRFVALASDEDGARSEQTLEAERDVRETDELCGPRVEVKATARGKWVVQGNGLKFNKAYMASNPSRLSKGDKRVSVDPKEVAVVSLMEGVTTEGVVRDVSAKKGNHVAVTHGLDRDYEVMDDDDPDWGTFETEMEEQLAMVHDEVVEVVDDEIVPR